MTIHSQDGDRMEKPAKTGWRTSGDFSALMVALAGTTGDRPAAMTLISSGVSAATARQPAPSRTSATRPDRP